MVIIMEVSADSSVYENEASLIWNAKRELRTILLRVLEIIARFGQFKVRELVSVGFRLRYNVDTEVGDNHLRLTLEIFVPRDFVVEYARAYSFYARIINRIMRIGTHNENVKYGFKDFSREYGFLMEDLEREMYEEEGVPLHGGATSMGSTVSRGSGGGHGGVGGDVEVVLEEPTESVVRATMEEIKSGKLGELIGELEEDRDKG